MRLIDMISFDPSKLQRSPGFYGFDRFLQTGKDIIVYPVSGKGARNSPPYNAPSIAFSSDSEALVRVAKKFDILYQTDYDASPALMTRASVAERKLLVNIQDILDRKGAERAVVMHRISRFIEFCVSYRAEFIIASMARDEFGIRGPQETGDLLSRFGIGREQVRYSYSLLGDMLQR